MRGEILIVLDDELARTLRELPTGVSGDVIVIDSLATCDAEEIPLELKHEPLYRPSSLWQPRCQKCNRKNPQGTTRCNWCGGKVR